MSDNTSVSENKTMMREIAPPSPLKEFWGYFSENKGAVAGLFFIATVLFAAIFADIIAPYDPFEQYREHILVPPVWAEGGNWSFLLGTDEIGRDMLSRLIHGARLSLLMGLIAVTIAVLVGTTIGVCAGFFRGIVDTIVMRIVDIIMAIPSLLLALVIVTILGPGLKNAAIAIAITYLPFFIRLSRASVISEVSKDYVMASRVAGASKPRLMFNVILPNCMAPLIVQATLNFSTAILDAAALGFIGLGAQPPNPEWGSMLSVSLEFIQSAPWVVILPGLMIFLTVLAFNLMGDGLRDALDPKMKR